MPESPCRPSSPQECPALACRDPTPASSVSPCAERQAAAIAPRNEQELAQAPWRRRVALLRPVTSEQRHPQDLLELASPLRLMFRRCALVPLPRPEPSSESKPPVAPQPSSSTRSRRRARTSPARSPASSTPRQVPAAPGRRCVLCLP